MINQPDERIGVLYIDDGSADHDAVRRRVQADARFRLVVAGSADEVDRSLANERFDLVLGELSPWGLEPLWILDRVRVAGAGAAVSFLTSRGSEALAAESIKAGAVDYLVKSTDSLEQLPDRLAAAVRQRDDRARQLAERDRTFERSLDLVSVVGFDGYFKRPNRAFAGLLGYTHDEIMTIRPRDLVHPEDRILAGEIAQSLYQGRQVLAVEMRMRCKDGSYKWVLSSAVPCVEQQVYYATGQNITSRKSIEEQLRESQERFQLIASATNEAVWDWDLRENRLWRNETYRQIFGEPAGGPEDTIEWWLNSIHPDDRQRVLDAMPPPLVEGRQQWVLEYRLRRVDGQYAHVYDRGFVVFDSAGEPVRMVGSIMDISELKTAEEKLRESEERFSLAAKATRDAIWDWDMRQGLVWRSESFQTLFGYRADEIHGGQSWWLERIHDDDRQRVVSQFRSQGTADSRQCNFEYRFRRADGTYADVIDRGFVMCSPEGKPVRMIGTIMDVSERRRAEELAHVQRSELAHIARLSTMGEIATGLAHELNQPLAAIANYAESCARAIGSKMPAGDERLPAWIEKIAANTYRAGEIIRRLRAFTRKSEPRRSPVEVNDLVQEVIDLLEAETRMQSVRIRWEPGPQATADVDPIQIQQVLVNLLHNAYEAMSASDPEQRQVTIAATTTDDEVEITVEDRGEGIPPENRERIFESFFTTKTNGVGIGLAISRSIVEDHDGRLWVTSNPARGVTFHFNLPLAGAEHVANRDGIYRR